MNLLGGHHVRNVGVMGLNSTIPQRSTNTNPHPYEGSFIFRLEEPGSLSVVPGKLGRQSRGLPRSSCEIADYCG